MLLFVLSDTLKYLTPKFASLEEGGGEKVEITYFLWWWWASDTLAEECGFPLYMFYIV